MDEAEYSQFVADTVIALERAALDRWGQGDPGGYLEISAPDVTYFDPYVGHRVDGLAALQACYEPLRGKVQIDSDDMVDPCVQVIGDAAILTFHYFSQGSEGAMRWNCTEVYCRAGDDWTIVHTHWSLAGGAG